MQRFAAIVLLALLLALAQISVMLAHARFDHSTPNPGQVLPAAPAKIDIFTAQQMRKIAGANEITVTGSDGARADDGNTVVDDADRKHVSVGLRANLPQGRYLVSFKTLSDEDGENDHGQFAFYVGVQPTNDQKLQDEKLLLTSKADDEKASASHTGLVIGVAAAVAIVLLVLGFIFTRMRKRRA